jgi:hypothetical protein
MKDHTCSLVGPTCYYLRLRNSLSIAHDLCTYLVAILGPAFQPMRNVLPFFTDAGRRVSIDQYLGVSGDSNVKPSCAV